LDFVPAGELRVGETLRNLDGVVRIESIEQLGSEERVYNLEIHGEHVFRVASSGLLVHNSSGVEAPKGGYLTPGIGSSVPGQSFTHGWIKHDLYNQLNGLVGKADMNKFLAALKKGIVGPTGESGIKIFSSPVGKYTHELKIGGSAQRVLGYIDENGVLIFDKFVRGGLH
jgi:hypothetical protein